jgi:tetratricopeptide (TPR) repeat protein
MLQSKFRSLALGGSAALLLLCAPMAAGVLACAPPEGQTVQAEGSPPVKAPPAKATPKKKPATKPMSKSDKAAAQKLFTKGLKARSKADYPTAISLFEQAAALGMVRGWKEIGTTRMKTGEMAEAIVAFETFLEVAPDHEQAKTVRMLVKMLKKQR